MKPPVLLTYNLQGERAAKTRLVAMRFRVRVRNVSPLEYDRTLEALIENAPETDGTGEPFAEEMLVMANFPAPLVQAFLQGLRRAGVPGCSQSSAHAHQRAMGLAHALQRTVQGARNTSLGRAASVHAPAVEPAHDEES